MTGLIIPYDQLSKVLSQLHSGKAVIVFDPKTETCNMIQVTKFKPEQNNG